MLGASTAIIRQKRRPGVEDYICSCEPDRRTVQEVGETGIILAAILAVRRVLLLMHSYSNKLVGRLMIRDHPSRFLGSLMIRGTT
jgi:hypothetical protein